LGPQSFDFFMQLLVLFLESILSAFNLLYLGFGRFDERGMVVEDVFSSSMSFHTSRVVTLPELSSGA
jgi:hypothetical protein